MSPSSVREGEQTYVAAPITVWAEIREVDKPIFDNVMRGVYWVYSTLQDTHDLTAVYVVNNRKLRGLADFPFPRAMIIEDQERRQLQVIQVPNELDKFAPHKDLELRDGNLTFGSLSRIYGLYQNTKFVARDVSTIQTLIGIEEATHALCQNTGIGYIFANRQSNEHTQEAPRSQAEEDYDPQELAALLVQYLFLSVEAHTEKEALANTRSRIVSSCGLQSSRPYSSAIKRSMSLFINKLKARFPENDLFNISELQFIIKHESDINHQHLLQEIQSTKG